MHTLHAEAGNISHSPHMFFLSPATTKFGTFHKKEADKFMKQAGLVRLPSLHFRSLLFSTCLLAFCFESTKSWSFPHTSYQAQIQILTKKILLPSLPPGHSSCLLYCPCRFWTAGRGILEKRAQSWGLTGQQLVVRTLGVSSLEIKGPSTDPLQKLPPQAETSQPGPFKIAVNLQSLASWSFQQKQTPLSYSGQCNTIHGIMHAFLTYQVETAGHSYLFSFLLI